MGIRDLIKNIFSNSGEISSERIDRKLDIDYPYPLLLNKCSEIYASMTKYEYCLCGIEAITFDKEMYEKTKDEMFLESLEKNKYTILVKPQIIKDLISYAKDTYELSKTEFSKALEEIFKIIATNPEYTSKFCYDYFTKELERYIY